MPAYHSAFNGESNVRIVGNLSLLPFHSQFRGPAPPAPDPAEDVVEETLELFRANVFFRNYEIKGPADRLLIYGTLFISECLSRIAIKSPTPATPGEASKLLLNLATAGPGNSPILIPGDPGFSLNAMYAPPASTVEADQLRQYLSQFRQELASRLVTRLYDQDGHLSKWWMSFHRRKFLGKTL
ncbi:MAG: putative ARC18-subunit of the Arp2/3 complex [Piptocephalis tieghemiana]|nr:MAG: putative ARC18-subunit of the Arp2/3 complex [Piptocephalis tieghemiana]